MNVELLRKAEDALLLNLWAFDMHEWKGNSDISPCGSTACIAGWVNVIKLGKKRPSQITFSEACDTDICDLGFNWDILCLVSFWPGEFRDAYNEAREVGNHEAAALIAAARIERYIETNGEE